MKVTYDGYTGELIMKGNYADMVTMYKGLLTAESSLVESKNKYEDLEVINKEVTELLEKVQQLMKDIRTREVI